MLSNTKIVCFFSILICAVFISHFLSAIQVENRTIVQDETGRFAHLPSLGNSSEKVFWLVQISDLHLSHFFSPDRTEQFKDFCLNTIPVLKPKVVIASGDLTDAMTKSRLGSMQQEQEWKDYYKIVSETGVTNHSVWLDIRGNHDNFNVAGPQSSQNFFKKYSVQGKTHPRSYIYQIKFDGDLYSFIAVDGCLDPGQKRPFNFIGFLDKNDTRAINKLVKRAEEGYLIWFGHFPTSCLLVADPNGTRNFLAKPQNAMAYLCGHLHTLGGMVPHMYALQKEGFLELELGDWRANRKFRILAIDHGLLSFVDVKHGPDQWPIILITNPKDPLYAIPGREPLEAIATSTHIRILVFSTSRIMRVSIQIDNGEWMECTHSKGPLYTHPWKPEDYKTGLHTIKVLAKDEFGQQKTTEQPFSIDGTKLGFPVLGHFFLTFRFTISCQVMFSIFLLIGTLPFCILRIFYLKSSEGKFRVVKVKSRIFRSYLRRFWILASVDRFFYPLMFYPIYLSIGPWAVGYLVEDYIGVIFIWGTFVRNTFLPGTFTYLFAVIQMMLFHIPLLFILSSVVDERVKAIMTGKPKVRSKCFGVLRHLPFGLVILVQSLLMLFFTVEDGFLTSLLGPVRTWSVAYAIWLRYQASFLPARHFRASVATWTNSSVTSTAQH